MSQYGASQNTPYSGQQHDGDLVHSPRYQGQAGGTVPLGHDGRGPQDESRYGATPLSTGAGNGLNTTSSRGTDPVDTIRNPAAYGFQKYEPEGFCFPGATGASREQQQQQGRNTTPASVFAREQPGHGHPEFGAPSQGHNTSNLWPSPAAPPNARRSGDVVGQGGYGDGDGVRNQQPAGIVDKIKNAVGVGSNTGYGQQDAGYGPGHAGYDQQPGREGIVDKAKDAVGVGPNSGYNQGYGGQTQGAGYGQQPGREGIVDKAKDAVGMGPNSGYNQGYGQTQGAGYGQNQGAGYGHQPGREGIVDKAKDAVGVGPNSGYNQGYGQTQGAGYGQQPGREGIVDKAKDAVGVGPNSGYNQGYGGQTQGAGYGQQPGREGIVDKAKDAVGVGPNSGYNQGYGQTQGAGYGQQPGREGIVDKAKDAVGVGPNAGRGYGSTPGGTHSGPGEYNPNLNHHNEDRGFGGGHGYDQSSELGDGYHTGLPTGADAYGQSHQQRHEGLGDKVRDATGKGPNSGYDARTHTGTDAYVHGNHPHGQQDRIQGVNEQSLLGGHHGVHAGLGGRDGTLAEGEHVPESILGERRTEPGYDTSKGGIASHLPGHDSHHQKLGGTGLGSDTTTLGHDSHHQKLGGTGLGSDTNTLGHEGRRGEHDTLGTGTHAHGGAHHGTGSDAYNTPTTGTGTGYDGVHDTGASPPKKGLITKIKEKLHH